VAAPLPGIYIPVSARASPPVAVKQTNKLAVTSIRFLSLLIQKQMHQNLFQEEATLHQIAVLKIVIPNLMFRESDEE